MELTNIISMPSIEKYLNKKDSFDESEFFDKILFEEIQKNIEHNIDSIKNENIEIILSAEEENGFINYKTKKKNVILRDEEALFILYIMKSMNKNISDVSGLILYENSINEIQEFSGLKKYN